MTDVFDVGPVNVTGAARGHKARVVWHDGVLHVVHTAERVARYQTTAPVVDGHYWVFKTDEGKTIMATKRGCGG